MIKLNISGATIGALMFAFVLWIYYTKMPVVAFMDAEVIERAEHSVTVQVKGRKIRDCALLPDTWVGLYRNTAGEFTETSGSIEFPDDFSKDSSRVASWFERKNFGLFKINGVPANADTVWVTVQHLCDGDGIPRVTDNGVWYVGAYAGG